MRGARSSPRLSSSVSRIIPAYAGSTSCDCVWPWLTRDHPRVCGEHSHGVPMSSIHGGSSPRMRGALYQKNTIACGKGIIPAYAGSTDWAPVEDIQFNDHPRVCGEHKGQWRMTG